MTPVSCRIAPSILSADFAHLADEIACLEAGGADWIHVDVMDGRFVPNQTFGAKVIETVRKLTTLPLDVHLMVIEPENYFESFAKAGANSMTNHVEAAPHLDRQLAHIHELGCGAGLALNPGTPVEWAREVAAELDVLLIMTVNPGFGGQSFIPSSLDKVRRAGLLLRETKSRAVLDVDGGISRATIEHVWRAGADTNDADHAVFSAADPRAEIGALRALCTERA